MAATNIAPPDPGLVMRIIARPVAWHSLAQRADRAGLRLRGNAVREDGDLLVEATKFPFSDGAHILFAKCGLRDDTLVTSCHEGASHDSFVPWFLHLVAVEGARRAQDRTRLTDFRARHPGNSATAGARRGADPGWYYRACGGEMSDAVRWMSQNACALAGATGIFEGYFHAEFRDFVDTAQAKPVAFSLTHYRSQSHGGDREWAK